MKKIILLALPALLVLAGCGGSREEGKRHECKRRHLTEVQTECLQREGCPMPEHSKKERAEKTERERREWEDFRQCKTRAFEACGIEKRERRGERRAD